MQLNQNTIQEIKTIIFNYLSGYEFESFIFGSWATGTARENSDIDLGIKISAGSLDDKVFENLKNAFIESDIPYYIDVVDFNHTSEEFKKVSLNKILPLSNNVGPGN
jgi:predicted nucleotidyltransferase